MNKGQLKSKYDLSVLVLKKALTFEEAMVIYDLSDKMLNKLIKFYKFPYTHVGRKKYFHRDDVDEWFRVGCKNVNLHYDTIAKVG